MLFNSLHFFIFLPVVFGLYWVLNRSHRAQNLLVVISSYVFYGWWDWRFLILIFITSTWAYLFGLLKQSKWKLALSLVINLGILGYFKYYNFFVDSLRPVFESLGWNPSTLQIILPVGISFYTFQALSYTIDVYRGTIKATRDPIAFFAFISFFPQLVAGPIERATNLLPQFLNARRFDYALAVEGARQMLWGFFKKVLVADSCAFAANSMLNHAHASSITIWAGMIFFTFQIYGDFSGYSDIAIGCSKLFGIRLMRNFAYPYFARDIAEFWRRWHISLTTWFRDYLYIPLGGSRCSMLKKVRNTFAIFLVSGLWHGANWTFVCWGAFHAVCFLPLLLCGKNRKHASDIVAANTKWPACFEVRGMVLTFFLAVIGWTLFRATSMQEAIVWLGKMFTMSDLNIVKNNFSTSLRAFPTVVVLLGIEWFNRRSEIIALPKNRLARWIVYFAAVVAICYWRCPTQVFIYFQF